MTPFMMRKSFDDFDDFAEQVRDWSLDFFQLEPGPFAAEFSQYASPRLQLGWARFHVRLEQLGAPPVGYRTFVVPMHPEMRLHWRSHDVDGTRLLAFPSGSELYAVSRPDFHVCTVSIQEEWLNERAIALELPPTILAGRELLHPGSDALAELRVTLRAARWQLISAALDPREHAFLEDSIVTAVLRSIEGASELPHKSKQRCRERALQRVLEYLDDHEREPTTVAKLALIAGVSQRSLEHAFQDRFDLGPKRYLTARRMLGVRRALRRAAPESRVQDVAKRWGFRHLGQFAVDYRSWFQERPSETLR